MNGQKIYKEKAKNLLRRNASIFSKHDLDMGKTNLVKHNIILTDPIPFKERYSYSFRKEKGWQT